MSSRRVAIERAKCEVISLINTKTKELKDLQTKLAQLQSELNALDVPTKEPGLGDTAKLNTSIQAANRPLNTKPAHSLSVSKNECAITSSVDNGSSGGKPSSQAMSKRY
jgi:hypothetical protein